MLSGLRIIDLSQYLPGPYASLRLVDRGAEVLKVEPPKGDPSRYPTEADGGDRYTFRANNRGKKNITLDLKDEQNQLKLKELICQSDVVLESFRPGVTDRLGISYDEIKKIKPDIIYCSLTGYGQTSSLSHLASHDINYMSISGLLSQLKDKEGTPVQPSNTFADLIGGMAASEAIMAAVFHREKTGKGSYIDLAIADVMLSLMNNHIMLESAIGEEHGVAKLNNHIINYSIYKTKDNRYISIGALEFKFWKNFCLAVDKKEWVSAHMSLLSDENMVFQDLKKLFKTKTMKEWTDFSREVDCCITPVLESSELVEDLFFKERNIIFEKDNLKYVSTQYGNQYNLSTFTSPVLGGSVDSYFEERLKK